MEFLVGHPLLQSLQGAEGEDVSQPARESGLAVAEFAQAINADASHPFSSSLTSTYHIPPGGISPSSPPYRYQLSLARFHAAQRIIARAFRRYSAFLYVRDLRRWRAIQWYERSMMAYHDDLSCRAEAARVAALTPSLHAALQSILSSHHTTTTNAAVRIQSMWRGWSARFGGGSVRITRARLRVACERAEVRAMTAAEIVTRGDLHEVTAVVCQRAVRCFLARRRVAARRTEAARAITAQLRSEAVTAISRVWRGCAARQQVKGALLWRHVVRLFIREEGNARSFVKAEERRLWSDLSREFALHRVKAVCPRCGLTSRCLCHLKMKGRRKNGVGSC